MRNFGLTAIIYFMWKNILKSLLLFWLPCLLKGDRSVPAPCFHSKSHCLRVSLLPMPVFCPQFQLLFVLAQVYMEANSLKLQNEARLLTNSYILPHENIIWGGFRMGLDSLIWWILLPFPDQVKRIVWVSLAVQSGSTQEKECAVFA